VVKVEENFVDRMFGGLRIKGKERTRKCSQTKRSIVNKGEGKRGCSSEEKKTQNPKESTLRREKAT